METSSPLRFLVVDDDSDTKKLFSFIFEAEGVEVISASSVPEALEAVKVLKPDILISDIGLPEEDGYSLIQQVRGLKPDQGGKILAIAVTAYASEDDRHRALAAGFNQHISKPVEISELISLVFSLIGKNN